MALTVKVHAPTVAVELAESLIVLDPLPGAATVAGEKLAVTPAGSPVTVKAMAELNAVPFAVVRVIEAVLPRARLALAALAASVNVGGRMVRLKDTVLSAPAPAAPSVNVWAPAATVEATDSVKVLLPFPGAGMLVLLKLAVTPLGSPLTDKLTL